MRRVTMIKGRRASSKEHYEICRSWRGKSI
nr:MAG TPA: hypothetical protein [Caudoviricetes sp.]